MGGDEGRCGDGGDLMEEQDADENYFYRATSHSAPSKSLRELRSKTDPFPNGSD